MLDGVIISPYRDQPSNVYPWREGVGKTMFSPYTEFDKQNEFAVFSGSVPGDGSKKALQ
jgi:hypothetical protein